MSTSVRFRSKPPTYRQRKGYTQALVTLTDSATRQRRDYWLGEHGSPQSREAYHRIVAAWEANERRFPKRDPNDCPASAPGGIEINELIHAYWRWAQNYYRHGHLDVLRSVLGLVRKFYGTTPAADFGPKKLRELRDHMIRGDARVDTPRKPWSRRYINSQVKRIRHMFKWGAAEELVPITVWQALAAVEPLKRGRTTALEREKVGPVPTHLLSAVRAVLPRPVKALVELQLLTGARPGELLGLRPADMEMRDDLGVWLYRPNLHKNAYRERERVIYFGPNAQHVLRPFLSDRPTTAYLFSPAEAEVERREVAHAARKTPMSCGNRPGSNRRAEPTRQPHDRYTTNSYARAIRYACERAFPMPQELRRKRREAAASWHKRIKPEGVKRLQTWRRETIWHPHQLRHSAGTEIRRVFGLEAAQVTLGHASAQITDSVYAERDQGKVIEIMRKIG